MTIDDSLIEFVQASVDLANCVGADLRKDGFVSDNTMKALAVFIEVHDMFSQTLDPNKKDHVQ